MSARLQIVITVDQTPPNEITGAPGGLGMHMAAAWLLGGEPQPCADNAIILSALEQAKNVTLANTPFRPPTLLRATAIPAMPPAGGRPS